MVPNSNMCGGARDSRLGVIIILFGHNLELAKLRPRKNPIARTGFFRGAGNETLTRGLILGKDAL